MAITEAGARAPGDARGSTERVLVVGAGPAGLTAAYTLGKRGVPVTVVEADDIVGGISRTVERDGWRFDIGGHRFFTKVKEVEDLWHEILPEEDFPVRPRMSRIYYRGRFFDYPLRAGNALKGLGVLEAVKCVLSYVAVRIRPPRDTTSFEGWVASRFGWRLYRTFFKTYTEKLWGVPATEIRADWAAQRIKNLSLGRAIVNALSPRKGGTDVTSLIEEFRYPRLGPGMMWEKAAELVQEQGSELHMRTRVVSIARTDGGASEVTLRGPQGEWSLEIDHLISSMPLPELVRSFDPPAPEPVLAAAAELHFRDFLTVALVVPVDRGFPDNWIYVHSPEVTLGRIQNFGSWSDDLVKDGFTCLGLEYFVFEGDDLWTAGDDELIALGTKELASIGLVDAPDVVAGYVVRMPKAYPVYDEGYAERVDLIREFLAVQVPNVTPVGRNGMHRYNN
ncbi:MAG TPA: NAD(P)/FAD-dependent oxidoreductase, partial [Acidimicrobiales bacterium]|nr:NAD(P)/FAD-dependent oxidoreductase [Acidimicrobiales bacterium]